MSQAKVSALRSHASPITSSHGAGYAVVSKLFVFMTQLPRLVQGLPIYGRDRLRVKEAEALSPQQLYLNLLVSALLVLLGGCFAGLTIGLMGQDEVYLKVLASSGDEKERKHSRRVLSLISRGKHWVLITLLLSNVITNETLPIILDRCLGGGWPAVVTSTASIVIFGEIIPQSICVRYGLEVGSYCSPFVLILMYIMYPIAYPIALFLDHILGQDHGTVYKKSGLKTLVTLHKTMGVERLNQDEVTIISAVLDLKEKAVSSIMTPIDRVYTMSADTLLDEKTVEEIFNAGFSRIPIHLPGEPMNFIGMLLVRVLISYDPEDALPVASFPLATLPETGEETSCLNILNYFQEGKSHMIVVSSNPGEPYGALGVLTLEDVIEELIGEEIVDESDVYIDINKSIKRTQPGPLSKRNLTSYLHNLYHRSSNNSNRVSMDQSGMLTPLKDKSTHASHLGSSPGSRHGVLLANASPILGTTDASKTWKPINLADNPLETSKAFVHIKRPNVDNVKNTVLPGPKGRLADSNGYGTIHLSEESAAREAKEMINDVKENGAQHSKFLLPDEREADLTDVTDGHKNRLSDASSATDGKMTVEFQGARSYRTGGIIESIVNVQGVHKTIIENVSDEEMDHPTLSGTPSYTHDAFGDDNDAEKQLLGTVASASSSSSNKKKKRSKHKR